MQVLLTVAAIADAVLMLVVAWAIIRIARAGERTATSVTELRNQAQAANALLNRMSPPVPTPKATQDTATERAVAPGTPW